MISPAKLDKLPAEVLILVEELQKEIIADICRRVTKANYLTPTAEWQLYKANQLQLSYAEVNRRIARQLKQREKTVRELYTDTVKQALKEDGDIYRIAAAEGRLSQNTGQRIDSYFRSAALSRLLSKGLKNTQNGMRSLCNSMASQINRDLSDAMDTAHLKVISGAYSYNEAVYAAVKELADKGITRAQYPSGRCDNIDVCVRRAVLSSVNKSCCDIQLDLAQELGSELVEVSSHFGARPSHAEWQGQIYSLKKGHPKYPYFYDATGYGTGEGLGGWNCRHNFFPYFEGIDTPFHSPEFTKAENAEYYALTQTQRRYERAVRDSKRQLSALDGARQAAKDPVLKSRLDNDFARRAVTLKRREARLNDFIKANDLQRDNSRVRVAGFGKSVSQRAVWAEKRLDNSKINGIINNEPKQLSELGKFKQRIQNDKNINSDYYNVLKNRFSNGSDIAKKAYNRLVPHNDIKDFDFAGTAYYNPKIKQIVLSYSYDINNPRGAGVTWFHEHGHMIDDFAGNISNNSEFIQSLRNDYMNYMRSYGKKHNIKTFDKVQYAISLELSSMRKHSAVSDLLGGISKENIMGVAGHDPEYWSDDSMLCAEAFAHMFEAQFDTVRYKEMKKYFPSALSKFEELLGGIV